MNELLLFEEKIILGSQDSYILLFLVNPQKGKSMTSS